MNAGTLEIEMMANLARLQKDMDDARRVVGSTMSGIKESVAVAQGALVGLGIVGVAGMFVARVKEAIDYADKLDELSQKSGITTESLSQLQYAAKMGGAEAETFNTAMKKLNQSIAGGLAGDKEKVAWFKQLGVTFKDAQGQARGADDVLLDLADTFEKSKDGAGKASAAVALMGKAGDEMIPLLNGGAQSIRDLMTEADKMGLTISGDFAKAAGDFNDSLDRIDAQTRKLTILLAGEFVTGLGKAMQAMADATVQGGKLAGMISFVQTLLTGDDLHKANVATVKGTELVMAAEMALAKAVEEKDEKKIARLTNVVNLRKQELATDNNYRRLLEEDERKRQEAADKLKAKREGNPITPPKTGGGSTESEYERLIKRVQESLAVNDAVLGQGRELTAAEKLRVAVLQQMDATKKALTATERAALTGMLEENVQRELQVTIEKAQVDEAKRVAAERQRLRTADYEAVERFMQAEREAEGARSKTMKDVLQGYQDEIAVLGLTNAEREVAIRLREIERQGLDRGSAAYAEYAAQVRASVMKKDELQQARDAQVAMWEGIDSAARDTFVNIGKNGTNVFDKLKDSLRSGLYSVLYDMTVKQWLIQIRTQIEGPAAAGGGSGLLSALGGLVSAFGTGPTAAVSSSLPGDALDNFVALSGLAGRKAAGGPVLGGGSYLVGENGPEIFTPAGSGGITPNDKLGGQGGNTLTFAPVIQIDSRTDQAQIHGLVTAALKGYHGELVSQFQKYGSPA